MDEAAKPASSPEDDARALAKAEEIRRDGKRMKAIRSHVRGLHRALGISRAKTRAIAAGRVRAPRASRAPRHVRRYR